MSKINKLADFSAVIFDLDGLVLDTESTYFIAWKKALLDMGFEFKNEFYNSLSGLSFQNVEQSILNVCGINFDLKEFNRLSGQYWRENVDQQGIPVRKGFFKLLECIKKKNISFCLATNSNKVNALNCLKLAALENVFPIVITSDQVRKSKPAADIFLVAAESLKTPISHCLVLEDSSTGIQAAVNAGAISVFIPSVFPFQSNIVELADYFFPDLDELAQIIHEYNAHPV